MSLGLLSRWYDSLKPVQTRRVISRVYGINEDVLKSWLRHLSVVRNLCAYFMDTIAPNHHLRSHLLKLLSEHPERLAAMGFPVDWHQMGIWQDVI